MKLKFIFSGLFLIAGICAMAQQSETFDKANMSVQEEMKIMHKELDLTAEQQYHIIELLGEKRTEKEEILAQIEKLKASLDNIDEACDKKIMQHLNEEQRNSFSEELLPQLKELRLELQKE